MKFAHKCRIVWKIYLKKLYIFVMLIIPVLCFGYPTCHPEDYDYH
jgi:hypothetical protein